MKKNKAIFLDRDGTINIDKGYLYKKEEFQFEINAVKALKRLSELGYILIVVTNQSGIGRGYYTEEDFEILNNYMNELLLKEGIKIEKAYYCPHHPEKGIGKYKKECNFRKPNPGMILKGIEEFNVDIKKSFMVGDKISDVIAGIESGVTPILLTDEKKYLENKKIKHKVSAFKNLDEFSKDLLEKNKK
ncbi:D-glycero-beta-D-manno-heptose 1,7-bisphosphate 7-phosphatase [Fusobacterium sp. MFO224]|uniref:D-glycero-beta-D-manno-heptose 1,7-bisphosphate 7-phosphatase n=1 Tax=Fusobacterium sp. MFO224 TaxID=3378070 RepID=UPI003852D27A